jgi:putative MFS transporter
MNGQQTAPISVVTVGRLIDGLRLNSVLRFTLAVAVLGYLFDSFDNQIVAYSLPVVSKLWHLKPVEIGAIASAGLWGSVVGAYLFGYLGDRFGRRFAFIGSVAVFAVLSGLVAGASGVDQMRTLRFLSGIGLGGVVAIDGALIAEYAPTRFRSRFIGAVPLVFPLGQILAALVARAVIPTWGWQVLFLIAVLPALLAVAARWRIPQSPRWLAAKGRAESARDALLRMGVAHADIVAAEAQADIGEGHARAAVWAIFSREHLRNTAAVSIMWLANFPYWGFLLWLPTIFTAVYHLSIVTSLTFSIAVSACGFLGRLVSVYLIDRFGRRPVIGVFTVLTGLAALAFGAVHTAPMLLLTACVFQLLMDIGFLSINVITPEVFPTRVRASGAGWGYGLGRILGAIAPAFLGILLSGHNFNIVWIVMCLVMLAASVGGWLATETRGRSLEQISELRSERA